MYRYGPFKLGLAQCRHPHDGDVGAMVERWVMRAEEERVNVIVFPESLSTPFELDPEAFANAAEPIPGPTTLAVGAATQPYGMWSIFTVNEKPDARLDEDEAGAGAAALGASAGGAGTGALDEGVHGAGTAKPFNTAVLMDGECEICGRYRKVHLFDTDAAQESEKVAAGRELFEPFWTPYAKIGIGICYDLRFPELARDAALRGCELMVYPSAWVDGPGKVRQWKTLLSARAIENGMYVAGVSRCDRAFGSEKRDYAGHSCVFDPTGAEIASAAGIEEELLVAEIDPTLVWKTRASVPSLANRRPDVYDS